MEEKSTAKSILNEYGLDINLPPLEEPCKHQFFEVANIGYSPMSTEIWNGKEQLVSHPWKGGRLVICALCGERRQLWDNGDILFDVDGVWKKPE